MLNIFKELKWRNLIYNKTKKIKHLFKKKNIKKTIYLGIDPTSDSLHIGHLSLLLIIKQFYNINYNIIIVLGGFTGLIGDLSDKKNIINITNKKIKNNIKIIKKQILNIFKKKKIKIYNNKKWIKNIKLLDFINKILKKISVNNILKFKFIKKKIINNYNIKLSEFIYHVLQGFDYLYLNKKYNCNLQIGGSDQWNNIITGINLIKKIYNKKVYGLTIPLLLKSNGQKFSKSNKDNVWINKKKTSIYNFYQYFINLSDKESYLYIKSFFLTTKKNIKNIIKKHNNNFKKKIIQNYLAKKLTCLIHGKKSYKEVKKITNILFFKKKKNILFKIKQNFNIFKKHFKIIKFLYLNKKKNINIYDLIKVQLIFKSNSEYKKYIKNNGILLINFEKIKNNIITNFNNLFLKNYLIIQKGKKTHYLIKIDLNE